MTWTQDAVPPSHPPCPQVHQFCGGFNQEAGRLFDALHEQTVHYARMMDPSWFRSSKLVRS